MSAQGDKDSNVPALEVLVIMGWRGAAKGRSSLEQGTKWFYKELILDASWIHVLNANTKTEQSKAEIFLFDEQIGLTEHLHVNTSMTIGLWR